MVNVLSVPSWLSFGHGYEISKAAAWSATNSLRLALRDQGTTVTALHVADGDVLYRHVGLAQPAEGEETPEGHVVRFAPGTQRIVGLTVINARHVLDRDGRLIVTVPETVEASADELARALHAA